MRQKNSVQRAATVSEGAKLCDQVRADDRAILPVRTNRRAVSLHRNMAWALGGNLGYVACQWGILVCIAKLGTAADVGRFALGLAVTAPVITFANLHLRVLEATDARQDYPFSVYLSLRLLTTSLAIAAIAVIAVGLGYRGSTFCLIIAVAMAKAFEAVSDMVFGLLQRAENLRRVAISMLAKGVISVLAMGLVLRLGANIVVATLAMALCWASLLALYDLPAAARLTTIRPAVELRSLTGLARLALPMGCVAGLNSLTANVPRYAVEANLGPTALGHFAALAYLFTAGSQPLMALGAATNARFGRYFVTDRAAFRQLTRRTTAAAAGLGVVAIVGAALFGRTFLAVAYSPEYAAHAPVLIWLAVAEGVSFVSTILGYAVTAARRLPEQLPIAGLSLALCAGASHLLVPRYGLVGAAWAVLATEGMRLLCLGAVYAASISAKTPPGRQVAMSTSSPPAIASPQ